MSDATPFLGHLHPRVDSDQTDQRDEYAAHREKIAQKIKYRASDYNELMEIASLLSGVRDEEKIAMASRVLIGVKAKYMAVDVVGAIDEHLKDIESYREEALAASGSLVCKRLSVLREEAADVDRDTAAKAAEVVRLENELRELRKSIDHNNAVRRLLQDDIDSAMRDNPIDRAAEDARSELVAVKDSAAKAG